MTKRISVSVVENSWHDAQRVDQSDLEVEQNHNDQVNASLVQNHFGSGVLLSNPVQNVIFDSNNLNVTQAALLAALNFDGTGLSPHSQPSDINLGNQLEVDLTGSDVFGRLGVKVAIIGLSFDGSLQIDRFYFYRNEKQVTSKHYAKILSILTNDFKGNQNCSRTLGGRLVIREAASFQLSRDPLMVAQDVEPDLFWRDFKTAGSTLSQTLQTAIGPEYSVAGLNITTSGKTPRELTASDVTTQVGQKFLAVTNNIQKITLLLGSLADENVRIEDRYDWSGDLVISVYALQTTVDSPTDIVPTLAIDFDPEMTPLAQISYNQESLYSYGYVLSDVLQPVDFVFSATALGSVTNSVVTPGKYYAVTVKRAGSNSIGTLLVGEGNDRTEDARLTLFSGVWVDVPEEDLWFQVWTDAAKVADGQGYDAGVGIEYQKTAIDSTSGVTVDYQAKGFALSTTGENILNVAILQASLEESVEVQDERTGNNVFSRKKFIPSFSFVTEAQLDDLKETSEPLVIGGMTDTNPRLNSILEKVQEYPGLARGDEFVVVNPDADLLSLNLMGSKLVPNSECCEDGFRIFRVTLCTDGYGDVNGDGQIDSSDVVLATTLIGESYLLASSQRKIRDGYFDTLQLLRADVDGDGYVTSNDVTLITNYVNRVTNSFPVGSSFTHLTMQLQQSVGRWDGYFDCFSNGQNLIRLDGYAHATLIDPATLPLAQVIYDGYLQTPMLELDPVFSTVPFADVTYQIVPVPFWQPYLLGESSRARQVATSFSYDVGITESDSIDGYCVDRNVSNPAVDPGRNDFFAPDNFILGKGEILRPTGEHYKVDLEIGCVTLQLPATPLTESALNVFDKFVSDRGDGLTRAGYPAMKYADGTTVQSTDLFLNKVRFDVSLQSFNLNTDGYSALDGYSVIVVDHIALHMDSTTGILKLNMQDLEEDQVYQTLVTKIQILVYLKRGGWNNTPLTVSSSEIEGLISS